MNSDEIQLQLIRDSVTNPQSEEEAKKLFLSDLYKEIRENYTSKASNNGVITSLPECVKSGLCEEDLSFTYNGLRVLQSRYLSRNKEGKVIETPSMVMRRVSLGFKERVDPEKLYEILISRRFMFNSPTLFNMYIDGSKGALSACYVTPVYDDMKSIMDATVVQAMTFKYGGGQGFSFSNLRPRWSLVKGTGSYSSGPLSFMRIYDSVTDSVKQGGKRRGANMGILHDWHPDLYNPYFDPSEAFASSIPAPVKSILSKIVSDLKREGYKVSDKLEQLTRNGYVSPEDAGFIQAKRSSLGDMFLTNFNISVGVHDVFMESVIHDKDWVMISPQLSDDTTGDGDYKIHYSISRSTGIGRIGLFLDEIKTPFFSILEDEVERILKKIEGRININEKNPIAWKTKAKKIWDEIVRGAWETGDPGLLFLDNHNKWSPTPWLGVVVATNPCGEQFLYSYESCNLGSVSVEKYMTDNSFNVESFYRDIQVLVDAMDAVIDYNNHPDPRQDKANRFTRKIGLGIMGLADLIAKLGIKYDSDEAVAVTGILMAGLEIFSWKRSWELGAKLGHASAFDCLVWDWRNMKCIEKGDVNNILNMHTPALVKASIVTRFQDGWMILKYHDIDIPEDVLSKLQGETGNRVMRDGSVKIVSEVVLEDTARRVFGITPNMADESVFLPVSEVVNDPKRLLALAIWKPKEAWDILVKYGKSIGAKAPRNTVMTTVAPTGSISIIAGTSSGIEPYFALVYRRHVAVGDFLEVVREFRDRLLSLFDELGIDRSAAREIFELISRNKGSIRWALDEIRELPSIPSVVVKDGRVYKPMDEIEKLADLFATSMDFDPWYHVAHNAIAQLYVDQSISKTVNLRKDVDESVVNTVYLAGWLLGLKGVTVYRDESKSVQVIYFGDTESTSNGERLFWRENGNGRKRMLLPKKTVKLSEFEKDPKAMEIFKINPSNGNGDNGSSEVVVSLEQNSTCETCEF